MAKSIVKDVTILYANQDLSGDTNTIDMPHEREMKDATTFGSDGWREFLAGLKSGTVSFSGFREAADEPDSTLFGTLTGAPLTVTLTNPPSDGDVCYSAEVVRSTYSVMEELGEIAAFSVEFNVTQEQVRGIILHTGAVTSTANGTGQEHGAVTSGKSVFASLHILEVSGTSPTLDVIVESDADDTWASGVTRLTFTQETDATSGYQIMSLAGPVTDTWWRAGFTVGGSGSPSFTVRLTLGIQ